MSFLVCELLASSSFLHLFNFCKNIHMVEPWSFWHVFAWNHSGHQPDVQSAVDALNGDHYPGVIEAFNSITWNTTSVDDLKRFIDDATAEIGVCAENNVSLVVVLWWLLHVGVLDDKLSNKHYLTSVGLAQACPNYNTVCVIVKHVYWSLCLSVYYLW